MPKRIVVRGAEIVTMDAANMIRASRQRILG